MRLRITLVRVDEKNIVLPVQYNFLLQGFIYNNIDYNIGNFLHNYGYEAENRIFKLFVFSRIFSRKMNFLDSKIEMDGQVSFYLSSPIEDFIGSFSQNIIKQESLFLGENLVRVFSIEVMKEPLFSDRMEIKMISPLTVYSTFERNGKKLTHYYTPFENEFNELITENLKKKYLAYYKKEISQDLKITPINIKKEMEKIIIYKGTVIKGWIGRYQIEGSVELIKFAYNVGLGSKNSQGFGMFEICM